MFPAAIAAICCSVLLAVHETSAGRRRPNIVFILADDLGFNDVPWHNRGVVSPALSRLASASTVLEQAYAQPTCTPSRAALLTGYYPLRTGNQNGIIRPQEPTGLYTNFTLLPEHLRRLGYRTHLVGK